MKSRIAYLLILFFFATGSFAQMKVVIMGSSTAYGVGASVYSNSWAGRLDSYLNQNTSDGRDTTVYNISFPAYVSYQEMPNDFVPPAGRPLPDEDYNVTKALSYNPNVVIINLPSNDINFGYAKYETMFNFRLMFERISATGARCYFTTPQPRNDFTPEQRDSLFSMVDSVTTTFGPLAINFWDGLVTTDGLYSLREEYRASGTPIHVNDDGHALLFGKVLAAVFDFAGPVPLQLTAFQAQSQNNTVLVKWHTEQQDANTNFEVQRSADGRNFETVFMQAVTEARQSYNYTATDQTPLAGKSFYRLKVTHAARETYSAVVSITNTGKLLNISKLYTDNGGSNLNVEINVQKNLLVNISIIGTTGTIFSKQKDMISYPGNRIIIPINKLAAGQYFIRIATNDGVNIVKPFTK